MNTNQLSNTVMSFIIRTVFCLALVGSAFSAKAQSNYTRTCAGFNYVMPRLGNGYTTDPWKGVHVRNKFIELGYFAGRVDGPVDTNMLARDMYLGLNLPIPYLGFGKREYGIKGFLFSPYLAVDLCRVGVGERKGSWGITAAPGVSLQLPYILLDFRLNTIVGFDNVTSFKKEKYIIAPTLGLHFDGLWDVMDPKIRFDYTYEGVYTWTTSEEKMINYQT